MNLSEAEQQRICQNQRLLQNPNCGRHYDCEKRQLLSEIMGRSVPASSEIRLPFYSDCGFRIKIGERVFINMGVMMTDLGKITIEDDVLIGPGAKIITVNHCLEPERREELELSPVVIEKNAWIGAGATILPGVRVGKNAVVAAGAVVTKNVAPNSIVAGVPAKLIKTIK